MTRSKDQNLLSGSRLTQTRGNNKGINSQKYRLIRRQASRQHHHQDHDQNNNRKRHPPRRDKDQTPLPLLMARRIDRPDDQKMIPTNHLLGNSREYSTIRWMMCRFPSSGRLERRPTWNKQLRAQWRKRSSLKMSRGSE